ncbi:IclR family transcriptional regulator [Trinickia symbiotica]|uniref:IclR family transcriptional regulator n=1 Tax=Trinickia symbiotica TaxID=863227 RepID=A0A2N7X2T6_9BURK|nr:IclR family transcriptional regulator C-terminal domain-containing protein [Trinickia symbiotica]PMS36069.1 IclR family transcriptional regulator [Trinickia symbiotica]PPK45748.1 IclR family transcriptional regulator [Trinickia symbiotica]
MQSTAADSTVRLTGVLDDNKSGGLRALRRGLDVLAAIIEAGSAGLRVAEIGRRCQLERATVYRILETLVEADYVEISGRYRYVAGEAVRRWRADNVLTQSIIAKRLEPVLEHVSAESGDAAFAVVREGRMSSCIARRIGSYPVQILAVDVGTRQPLGVGAAGLALLAALPDDEAQAVIVQHGDALSSYGGLNSETLRLLVKAARERGWSVIGNHAAKGALGVGVAVCDRRGYPIAAISVAAPTERMSRQRQAFIVDAIRSALRSSAIEKQD